MDDKEGYIMNANQERKQIIKNAEAAYRRHEITAAFLLWLRIYTAKFLVKR
jgi:hypothetical protein